MPEPVREPERKQEPESESEPAPVLYPGYGLAQVFELRRPLTITYDLRAISMPSLAQIKQGMAWLGLPSATAPTHASLLDEYLQVRR